MYIWPPLQRFVEGTRLGCDTGPATRARVSAASPTSKEPARPASCVVCRVPCAVCRVCRVVPPAASLEDDTLSRYRHPITSYDTPHPPPLPAVHTPTPMRVHVHAHLAGSSELCRRGLRYSARARVDSVCPWNHRPRIHPCDFEASPTLKETVCPVLAASSEDASIPTIQRPLPLTPAPLHRRPFIHPHPRMHMHIWPPLRSSVEGGQIRCNTHPGPGWIASVFRLYNATMHKIGVGGRRRRVGELEGPELRAQPGHAR